MQNIIEESLIHELTEFFSEVEFFVIAPRNKMGIGLTNSPTIGILLNDEKYQTALTDDIQQKFALVFKDKSPKLILKIAENKNYFQMAVKDETSGIKFFYFLC